MMSYIGWLTTQGIDPLGIEWCVFFFHGFSFLGLAWGLVRARLGQLRLDFSMRAPGGGWCGWMVTLGAGCSGRTPLVLGLKGALDALQGKGSMDAINCQLVNRGISWEAEVRKWVEMLRKRRVGLRGDAHRKRGR